MSFQVLSLPLDRTKSADYSGTVILRFPAGGTRMTGGLEHLLRRKAEGAGSVQPQDDTAEKGPH